jgi:hypothetical protein
MGFGYLRSRASEHTVVPPLAPIPKCPINACRPFGFANASVGFRANRGAADGKLVLIHDVQSYIYAIASPVAAVLACFGELSPWLLASALVPPAQSVIAWFSNRASMLWYRWLESEGCPVGNRGKLVKALQNSAIVLLETIPLHSAIHLAWVCVLVGRLPSGCLRQTHEGATWLILPVVICLSQRLSHACLSINCLYCETANGSLNQL